MEPKISEKEVVSIGFSGIFIYTLDNKGKFTKGQALDIALREWEKTKEKMRELGIIQILTKDDIIIQK